MTTAVAEPTLTPPATATPPQETAPEQEQKEEAAAFQQGYEEEGTPTTETPAGTPDLTVPTDPDYIRVTKDEWQQQQDRLAQLEVQARQRHDETSGRIGGLQQLVKTLKTSGHKVQATPEDFAEFKSEFPEIAEMVLKGFNRAQERAYVDAVEVRPEPKAEATPPIDPQELVLETQRQLAREQLDEEIPDWRDIVVLPTDANAHPESPFRTWAKTLPKDRYDRLFLGNNPTVITKAIREFQASQKPVQPGPSSHDGSVRKQTVESGIRPTGAGGGPTGTSEAKSERAAFLDGYTN